MFRLPTVTRPQLPPGKFRHFGNAEIGSPEHFRWSPIVRKPPKRASTPPPESIASVSPAQEEEPVLRDQPAPPAPPPPVMTLEEESSRTVLMDRATLTKALKSARKKCGTVSKARPMLSTSARQISSSRLPVQKPQRKEVPAIVVTDELLHSVAERAYRNFKAPRIANPEQLIAVMLDPLEQFTENITAHITNYAVAQMREDVADAERNKIRITKGLLHARAMRVFGWLIGEAWKLLRDASSLEDDGKVSRRLRRAKQRRPRDGASGFNVLVSQEPEPYGTIYFLVEVSASSSKRKILEVWRATSFRNWITRRKRPMTQRRRSGR